jgi:hypothetical protein
MKAAPNVTPIPKAPMRSNPTPPNLPHYATGVTGHGPGVNGLKVPVTKRSQVVYDMKGRVMGRGKEVQVQASVRRKSGLGMAKQLEARLVISLLSSLLSLSSSSPSSSSPSLSSSYIYIYIGELVWVVVVAV